jgi:hypothetical protein
MERKVSGFPEGTDVIVNTSKSSEICLLDAEKANADWREVASIVLQLKCAICIRSGGGR